MLRNAREQQGITLEEIEEAIHIRRHLLEALEEDNFKLFSSAVVGRGLIRNYAKYLDLDPIEALTLYDGNGLVPVKGQRLTPNGIEFMNLAMTPRPIPWDVIISVVLFIVVVSGGSYWLYTQYNQFFQPGQLAVDPTPLATAPPAIDETGKEAAFVIETATPLPTDTPTPLPPTSTPTAIVYTGVTVELLIREASWVQIFVDDVNAYEGILQVTDHRQWTGQQRVAIRAGNAGGVEVVVNGVNRGVMGPKEQVRDQIWEKVEDGAVPTPTPPPTETKTP